MTTLYRERYEPLALAGRGAQGEVWMARDHVHDRLVALKMRDATTLDRELLLSEAKTLLEIRPHENLPLVRDDFFVDERYVMVMDWIEGRSLESLRLADFEDVLDHLFAVARALDHLHTHDPPIIHRDVKPRNVVVTEDGRTTLVDFGLAGSATPTYLEGTPMFVAPEVVAGEPPTPSSDIYSLAVTAFIALSGELPMPGRDAELTNVPEPWRERVQRAIGGALAIDPRLRPATATEFITSLRPPATPNNLPAELSTFVGREVATAELKRALRSSRMLTLLGPGGSGKTRLGLHLADEVLPAFPEGVRYVELAGVTEPDLVPSRVALAVEADPATVDVLASVVRALEPGSQLLVLDNCEHLVEACAHLTEALLRACPRLVVLATSRESLRVTGERIWRVQPLGDAEALTLFMHRVPLGVHLDAADLEVADEICRRLDGIPLAIELAAAQLASLELGEVAAALDVALGVLTGGPRTNPRQETIRATIDWSYRLLAADEQAALQRLAVFAGGFTKDAATDVSDASQHVERLVETSLAASGGGRFRLLETVRQFAAEKLSERGEATAMSARHAAWVADYVRRSDADSSPNAWLDRLSADHDNIEAALAYAVDVAPDVAARIARAATQYWVRRGYWVGGRRWIERTLAAADRIEPPLRSELLKRSGDMARVQGDLQTARARLEEAVALDRDSGDPHALAASLNSLGLVAHALGDLSAARSSLVESIELTRATGDRIVLARGLNNLAMVHDSLDETSGAIAALEESATIMRELGTAELGVMLLNLGSMLHRTGDLTAARRYAEEAERILAEHHNEYGRAHVLCELAKLDLTEGDVVLARERVTESLEIGRRLGDKDGVPEWLHVLALVAEEEGDRAEARSLHVEALEVRRDSGSPLGIARALSFIGALDVDDGAPAAAARRFGEAQALQETAGASTPAEEHVRRAIEQARQQLGAERFEREWNAGRESATQPAS